jgi:hypothetical protein
MGAEAAAAHHQQESARLKAHVSADTLMTVSVLTDALVTDTFTLNKMQK